MSFLVSMKHENNDLVRDPFDGSGQQEESQITMNEGMLGMI